MTPINFTREGLFPLWSDLSERTARARAEYGAGIITEAGFRARLDYLGFNAREIQIEVDQNRPTFRALAEVTAAIIERLKR